jgi:TonB-dependent SusC/RagA subfamily outer membrane receptor
MQLTSIARSGSCKSGLTQIIRVMKLTAFLLFLLCFQVAGRSNGQTVTLKVKNAPLKEVFRSIQKQTGLNILVNEAVLSRAGSVTLDVNKMPVLEVLKLCLKNENLAYRIIDNTIVLEATGPDSFQAPEKEKGNLLRPIDVHGRVVNEKGESVAGATIKVKGINKGTNTNDDGIFYLKGLDANAILVISGVNIETFEIKVNGNNELGILTVKIKSTMLDETIVQAYGSTTRKFNTGNITRVGSSEIERNPVSNPLAALQGRVPGMIISQTSGLPGAVFKVQIRGRSSLDLLYSRNDPLFIIDGVPFEPGNTSSNQISNATTTPNNATQGGLSPLNSINPSDIESIEVLKDADATAIYGSRGANGVILITTKKGRSGKLSLTANLSAGFSKVTRTLDMLNTQQYLLMRREAFTNDGITPTISNAPDLLLWDTSKYTNYKKRFQGGTARQDNIQIAASAGNNTTQFRMAMGYNHQTNIFDNDLSDKVISSHFSLNHASEDGRLKIVFSAAYSSDHNKLIRDDLTQYKNLPPHVQLTDANGKLKWSDGGVEYTSLFGVVGNPLSLLLKKYDSQNENLYSNFITTYRLTKQLSLRINFGYN